MNNTAPDAVASGMPYRVLDIAGRPPQSLDQFVGDTHFVVDKVGARSTVRGQGAVRGESVRFHEKGGDAGTGRDTRVWTITQTGVGEFVAASVSEY